MKVKYCLILIMLVVLITICYSQPYEPEHIWHRCGEEANDWFGRHIAGIGDVNNDGFGDFVAENGVGSTPHVVLFFGGNPPDTISDMIFNNPYPYGYFGHALENVGDVNDRHAGGQDYQWVFPES